MAKNLKTTRPIIWVVISGIAFVISLLSLVLLLKFAPGTNEQSLSKPIYFILLLPLGLCAAAFLFGAMRSHAKYVGKVSYGKLELAGPVVIFGLVVLGGLVGAPPEETFTLTVRVHGPDGVQQIIRNGSITLDLGMRISGKLNDNGEVIFTGLPAKFLNKEIYLLSDIVGYKAQNTSAQKIPSDRVIYFQVEPVITTITGIVLNSKRTPVKDVIINIGKDWMATSDSLGYFKLSVPFAAGTEQRLIAQKNGKVGFNDFIYLPERQILEINFKVEE